MDVASPETRGLGESELILSRLDDIASRLGNIEQRSRAPQANYSTRVRSENDRNGSITIGIPVDNFDKFNEKANKLSEIYGITVISVDDNGVAKVRISYAGAESYISIITKLSEIFVPMDGEEIFPF